MSESDDRPPSGEEERDWRLESSASGWAAEVRRRARDFSGSVGRNAAATPGVLADLWRFFGRLWAAFLGTLASNWREALNSVKNGVRAFQTRGTLRGERPKMSLVRRGLVWGAWGAGGLVSLILMFFVYVTWGMPSADSIWTASGNPSITILDRNGRVLLREGARDAPPVDLKRLPPHVAQAVLAIEDRRFYKHMGVDVGGLTRAVFENFRSGRVVQGGSTLTQQLAKNQFLTNERTFRRKAQEIALALWLESRFTKDQLLALYLSRVYFGAGAWGIEAASERYFDKPARELTLNESALLAGLLKAPSKMNPAHTDAAQAKARALVVLNAMVQEHFITPQQRDVASRAKLPISRKNPGGNLGYFRNWIEPQLASIIGDQRDDFIVQTTLDLEAQRAGERALVTALDEKGAEFDASQGALLSMDSDGGIRAMVGGKGFEETQFNRTTQAKRQPGSSFKFFIYLTAMEREGYSPWSVRSDEPIVIGDWAPGNYKDEYYGPVPLTFAFAKSLNMVAIRLANEIGGASVIETAKKLGVQTPLHNYRSLALGAQELPLIEMTTAYGAMASGGYRIEPHGISSVRTAAGKTIYNWKPKKARQRVISERGLHAMNFLMNRVIEAGTGTGARIEGRQIGGKTGTGNDYRDAWFVGFTSGLTTGVWVGNDDYHQMKKLTGGSLPARIWKDFMVVALRDTPATPLAMPDPSTYAAESDLVAAADPNAAAIVPSGAPLITTAHPAPPEEVRLVDGPEG